MGDRCCSYNGVRDREGVTRDVPEVALDPPAWSERDRPIMVDACIADAVRHLWDAGHVTLGSCCGHGQGRPSLVLGADERDFAAVVGVLAEVDDREWELLQWQLVEVLRGGTRG